jgi:hypothetical protein
VKATLAEIQLPTGETVVIDSDDLAAVAGYSWWASPNRQTTYAQTQVAGKTVYMHRLLMGEPDCHVDHRDGNGLNNTRENMRVATHSQNSQNRRKRAGTSSRYKGVSWCRSCSKWEAYISVDGRQRRLGYFDSEIDAALSYDAAASERFGEFARLNIPKAVAR